ncbi:hypothetical protein BsWGS_26337 [Bradybaena similaris]
MPISSPPLPAIKHVPSLYLATQDTPADVKQASKNAVPFQHLIGHHKVKVIKSSGQVTLQKLQPACQAKRVSAVISDSFLTENGQLQFSNRSQGVELYKCPSRHPEEFTNMIILDNVASITSFYDCPVASVIENIKAPSVEKSQMIEQPGRDAPTMEAKIIMRIRHKKMKKHKLKKLKKRMYSRWRKERLARVAKRMKIYLKELADIKKSGDEFNAEEFVKEQLSKAKKGGYSVSTMSK